MMLLIMNFIRRVNVKRLSRMLSLNLPDTLTILQLSLWLLLVVSILFIVLLIWFIGWKMQEFPSNMSLFTIIPLLGTILSSTTSTFPTVPSRSDRRVYLPLKGIVQLADDLVKSGTCFIQTSNTLFVPSTKVKYISQTSCSFWEGLDGRGYLMTPGEIARTELEREFGKPKIHLDHNYLQKLDFPVPQYWNGEQYEGYLWYVDLNSAYHQIYQYLTLDCLWPRGEGSLFLKPVADRVAGNKLARNAIVGISRARLIFMNTPEGSKRLYFHNPYLSPPLWRTIQSILHEIAETAIRTGARYVATDGYLFDNVIDFADFTSYLNYHTVSYKTEQGKGYIRGFADYKVGKKETKVTNLHPRIIDKIRVGERGTLQWWMEAKRRLCR